MKRKATLEQCINPTILILRIIIGRKINKNDFKNIVVPCLMFTDGVNYTELRKDGLIVIKINDKEDDNNNFRLEIYNLVRKIIGASICFEYISANQITKRIGN